MHTILASIRKIKSIFSFSCNKNTHSNPNLSDPELITQVSNALVSDLIQERRTERKWRFLKRTLITIGSISLFLLYFAFNLSNMGYKFIPSDDLIGMVRIEGEIASGSSASSEKVIPSLEKAFESKNVKTIMIYINSPGGQPVEANAISDYIKLKKSETKKPVYAVIGNVGASAAYIISISCDKIYASKYSLVGSIGAILSTWDFHHLLDKFDVKQNTFASGELKDMLSPSRPMTEKERLKAQSLVDNIGYVFFQDVKTSRGHLLKSDINYTTGEVWTGKQALSIGLIDNLTTPEQLASDLKLKLHDFGPVKKSSNFLFTSIDYAVDSITQKLSSYTDASNY